MDRLELVIKHEPIPWQRPGQMGKYRYDKQASLKRNIGYFFKKTMGLRKMFTGPISLTIRLYFKQPRTNKFLHKTTKPDVDNCAKFYMDCITDAGIWKDDAQVFDLKVTKYFIPNNHEPYVYFEIIEHNNT